MRFSFTYHDLHQVSRLKISALSGYLLITMGVVLPVYATDSPTVDVAPTFFADEQPVQMVDGSRLERGDYVVAVNTATERKYKKTKEAEEPPPPPSQPPPETQPPPSGENQPSVIGPGWSSTSGPPPDEKSQATAPAPASEPSTKPAETPAPGGASPPPPPSTPPPAEPVQTQTQKPAETSPPSATTAPPPVEPSPPPPPPAPPPATTAPAPTQPAPQKPATVSAPQAAPTPAAQDLAQALTQALARVLSQALIQAQQPAPETGIPTTPAPAPEAASAKKDEKKDDNDFRVFWKDGLQMATANKKFQLSIGGRTHIDFTFIDGHETLKAIRGSLPDRVGFRRARLYFAGTLYDHIKFYADYNFAGGDASFESVYVAFANFPTAYLNTIYIGHMDEPFGLEGPMSSNYYTFMEKALTNAFFPSSNLGIMLDGNLFKQRMAWKAGLFRETDSFGNAAITTGWNGTLRVTGLPLYKKEGKRLIHLGVDYSLRKPTNNEFRYRSKPEVFLAPIFVDTEVFNADTVHLLNAEVAGVFGPFSAQAEYAASISGGNGMEKFFFQGLYGQAGYFLTGEHRPYSQQSAHFGRVRPKRNLSFKNGGFGAVELAVRASYIDLNDGLVFGRRMFDGTFGVNWFPNPNFRLMFNYVFSDLEFAGDAHAFSTSFRVDF